MKKFKKLWNDPIRPFFADLLLFGGGAASVVHSQNGESWYWILLMITSCIFASHMLRDPMTQAK